MRTYGYNADLKIRVDHTSTPRPIKKVRTMLEWRRLAANRKVRRMAASMLYTVPVVHFTPSLSRYQFILLGEQRHRCVNNLPRITPNGGTAGNQTRNLSITNPTPYRYTTKPHCTRRPCLCSWRPHSTWCIFWLKTPDSRK